MNNTRLANENDIPDIYRMSKQFWALTAYGEEVDDESLEEMIRYCIQRDFLIVLVVDDEIHGFIAGTASGSMVNVDVLVGVEIAWWVDPEYRGYGKELLLAMENLVQFKGIKRWAMIILAGMEEPAKSIYESMGYKMAEMTFVKEF